MPEVVSLVEAFKHYSKYASQALKVAMPKGGMGRDINPRHMQQVKPVSGLGAVSVLGAAVIVQGCVDPMLGGQ